MTETEFDQEYIKRLSQLAALAVWNNAGKMYCPVWGYDNQIEAYAPYREAVDLSNVWVEENEL